MRRLIGIIFGALCAIGPASAQTPAAIVEDVQGKVDGAELMDYVAPGQIIKLAPDATLVLGYLKSCWRETVRGGVVLVGADQSTIQLGDVQRVKVPCDPKAAQLSDREASQAAATSFRGIRPETPGAPSRLPTIYGVAPIIEAKVGGVLVIERIDANEPPLSIPLTGGMLVRGRFYDLARTGTSLMPGGTYLARLGPRRFTFQVDAKATSLPTPIVGRLLRLD